MGNNKLYIRVDMNPTIATGHMMRCLSIADAAREMDVETIFLSADEGPAQLAYERGYELIVLGTDWKDMEGELWALETLIREREIESLLLDSYQVTEEYLEKLSKLVSVYYLDDENRFPYPVKGLINYNSYAPDMAYENPDTIYYLGCTYAPLLRCYRGRAAKRIPQNMEKVLIMSGGNDPYGVLEKTLSSLVSCLVGNSVDPESNRIPSSIRQITVICGRFYADVEELRKHARALQRSLDAGNLDVELRVIPSVLYVDTFLEEADLLICAGGSTLYEACAVGVPTISYSFVDNQKENVKWFEKEGIIPYAGDARYDRITENMLKQIAALEPEIARASASAKMQEIVDGRGANRIVKLLLGQ